MGVDPGRDAVPHGVKYPPAEGLGRYGVGPGLGCLLPNRGKVDAHEIRVVLLPRLEGRFVHVAVSDCLPQFLVRDGVLLILPHIMKPVHGFGRVGVEVIVQFGQGVLAGL